jgi:hypothetical protein
MKKLLSIVISSILSISAFGQAATMVLPTGSLSNFPALTGSIKVTSIVVTATNATTLTFVDTYTNSVTYSSSAYTNYTSYLTNYITTYTNILGVVNNLTNLALSLSSNSVPAATNSFKTPLTIALINTNGSTLNYPSVSFLFQNGLWITNGGCTATVTINYQKL